MQKSYRVLTVLDVPIPSYLRPYRNVLFVDNAPKGYFKSLFIISPKPKEKFQKKVKTKAFYFSSGDFSINQYKLTYRISIILKILVNLIRFRFSKNADVDFIRTGTTYISFLIRLTQKRSVPYFADVCDFYSDLYEEFNMPLGKKLSGIIHFIERVALKRPDLIFVDTSAQRDYLVRKFNVARRKCVVIPNGVLLNYYPKTFRKDLEVMAHYSFTSKDKIIFYGGDVSKQDGVELIFKYVKENRNCKALIIGKGNSSYIKSLNEKIKSEKLENNIIFDSFKPANQAYRYISVADVCLAPFQLTTTSDTVECAKIISYLMLGKRVLSTEGKGVKSLYKNSIHYFENNKYSDFANKLTLLLASKQGASEKEKLRKTAEKFDFNKIVKYEYKIINSFLKDRNKDFSNFDYI